jgi:GNAT superfamily N-acetyltransferase
VTLPDGLRHRPITDDDIDAVVAMVNACELHDSGHVMMERADLIADMAADGFERERDAIAVTDGENLLGWGTVVHRRTAWVDVHPDARGRGIGTWLRRWSEDRARAMGLDRISQTVEDARTDAPAMLRAAGYVPGHRSWVLRKDHPERPAEPIFPDGVRVLTFTPDLEDEALTMFEEAFSEFDDRSPSTLATWRAMVTRREGFVPDDLVLAVSQGRVVGGAFLIDADEIWVDKLAVHREHRRRGIARGLLQVAFRRSFDRGYRQTSLSTDSRTGALGAYERVGMRVVQTYTSYTLEL